MTYGVRNRDRRARAAPERRGERESEPGVTDLLDDSPGIINHGVASLS